MKTRLKILVGVCVTAAAAVIVSTAGAVAPVPLCNGSPGTELNQTHYGDLTLSGNAWVGNTDTLTVYGNLTLKPGACLDAFSLGTVRVSGSVFVKKGAILALGCAPDAAEPPSPCGTSYSYDTVGGSILADQPWTMYLTNITVWGNVVSNGGGPGPTLSPYVNFPIKDNRIYGNLIVQGWQGAWLGALRNTVRGAAIFENNVGVTIGDTGKPDANEDVGNTIFGNLICLGNSPAVGFGDSGARPNRVSVAGAASGECATDVYQPDPYYDGGGPQPVSVKFR